MSTAKKLALIGVGYALAVAGGFAAAAINDMFMPADISQTSPGMVAFGDMILFVLVAGFLGLAPSWFLLRLWLEKAPRVLLVAVVLIAAMGPASWLALMSLAGGPPVPNPSHVFGELFGLFLAFAAIPRIVAGPVVVVIEGATILLINNRSGRALLATAMLMDLVPLSVFAFHLATANRY